MTWLLDFLQKFIGLKYLISGFVVAMTVAQITFSLAVFLIVVKIVLIIYGMYGKVGELISTSPVSSSVPMQLVRASGLSSAITDVFSTVFPVILSFIIYKISKIALSHLKEIVASSARAGGLMLGK